MSNTEFIPESDSPLFDIVEIEDINGYKREVFKPGIGVSWSDYKEYLDAYVKINKHKMKNDFYIELCYPNGEWDIAKYSAGSGSFNRVDRWYNRFDQNDLQKMPVVLTEKLIYNATKINDRVIFKMTINDLNQSQAKAPSKMQDILNQKQKHKKNPIQLIIDGKAAAQPSFSIMEITDDNGNMSAIFQLDTEATQWLASYNLISKNDTMDLRDSQFSKFFFMRYIRPYLLASPSINTIELRDEDGKWFQIQGSSLYMEENKIEFQKGRQETPSSPVIYTASNYYGTINIDMHIDANTVENQSRMKKLYDMERYISHHDRAINVDEGIKINITGNAQVLAAAHNEVIPQIEKAKNEEKRSYVQNGKFQLGLGIVCIGASIGLGILFPPMLIAMVPLTVGFLVSAALDYKKANQVAKREDAASIYAKKHALELNMNSTQTKASTNDPSPTATHPHHPALSTFTPAAKLKALSKPAAKRKKEPSNNTQEQAPQQTSNKKRPE